MADNYTVDANGKVSAGTYASDEITSVHYPIYKLAVGADGAVTLVALGQAVMTASLPVVIASDQSDVKITLDSETVVLAAGTSNIGDVDVLSLPALAAGTNTIGKVQTVDDITIVAWTPSLDTSAYADGDVLADTEAVTLLAANDGFGEVKAISLIDKDDQKQALEIYFLSANVSLGSENSAPSISDADAANYLGHVAISAAEWKDLGGVAVAYAYLDKPLPLQAISGAMTVGMGIITRGAPTHTASGLVVRIMVKRF